MTLFCRFAPFCLALAILPVGGGTLFAQEDPRVDCDNQVTQFDMNYCANIDYEVADTALNATYKTVMAHMVDIDKDLTESMPNMVGAVDALKTAQRAWIGYRDGQCELAGFSARGGSMEPMLVSACLSDLTTKRTAELKELLEAFDVRGFGLSAGRSIMIVGNGEIADGLAAAIDAAISSCGSTIAGPMAQAVRKRMSSRCAIPAGRRYHAWRRQMEDKRCRATSEGNLVCAVAGEIRSPAPRSGSHASGSG